jgi:Family of unknown function (DUF6272)
MNQILSKSFGISTMGENVFFFYEGFFTQSIIDACADALKMRIDASEGDNKKTRRKLIGAFIELGQNIVHYSAEMLTAADAETDEVRFGSLKVEEIDDRFTLTCSNPVTKAGYERLEKKLSVLVTMSLDEIKQSYREALRAEGDAESKGGGIGFLTLARDASEPLVFSFADIHDKPDLKMFNLTVTV